MYIESGYSAGGWQIVFLTFAVLLLAVPIERFVLPALGWQGELPTTVSKLVVFIPALLALTAIRPVRRGCLEMLSAPVPRHRRLEVAAIAALSPFMAVASVGALFFGIWLMGGETALARRIGMEETPLNQMAFALSLDGLGLLMLAGVVAPVVEELIFRGYLFQAWARRWGWFLSMLATSSVFAIYHPNFVSAFIGGILFTCVLRRTGSLRASIFVHAAYNIAIWYPLLGQFLVRARGRETGEISAWTFHLVVLALVLIGLAVYAGMSRDAAMSLEEAPTQLAEVRP